MKNNPPSAHLLAIRLRGNPLQTRGRHAFIARMIVRPSIAAALLAASLAVRTAAADSFSIVPDSLLEMEEYSDIAGLSIHRTGFSQLWWVQARGVMLSFSGLARLDIDFGQDDSLLGLRNSARDEFQVIEACVSLTGLPVLTLARLGRQTRIASIDPVSFDGLLLEISERRAAIRGWYGLEAAWQSHRSAWHLYIPGSDTYLPDGIETALRTVQAAGAEAVFDPLAGFRLSLEYARRFEPGAIHAETIGATLRLRLPAGVSVTGDVAWSILIDRLRDLRLGLAAALPMGFSLAADYARTRPVFDGDSIFNLFPVYGFSGIGIRLAWRGGPLVASLGGERRFLTSGLLPDVIDRPGGYIDLISLSATVMLGPVDASAQADWRQGYGGSMAFASLGATIPLGRSGFSARATGHMLWHDRLTWTDMLVEARNGGLGGGADAGFSYRSRSDHPVSFELRGYLNSDPYYTWRFGAIAAARAEMGW